MVRQRRIVAATGNRGKLEEMRRLLASPSLDVVGLDAWPDYEPPEETGGSYLLNARIKALGAVRRTGLASFADDSGLEVDALDGAPGLRSARFDGAGGTPRSRNEKLLRLLDGVPAERRTARFRAVVVLLEPDDTGGHRESVFTGVLEGRIAERPSGEGGFGYDPVFEVPALGRTVASLPPERKDELSHRGQALRAMAAYLARRVGPS